jgi:hypothetical protein
MSFTNPTSTVGLQLLNLWLLKVMLRCVKDGDKIWTSDNGKRARDMIRWVVLHAVPYVRKSLRLENTQEGLQSGMPGSNSETRGRFCNGLDSNIVVFCWSLYYSSWHKWTVIFSAQIPSSLNHTDEVSRTILNSYHCVCVASPRRV